MSIPAYGAALADLDDRELSTWVPNLLRQTRPAAHRGPGDPVPTTHLWWVDGDTFLGRRTVRHVLPPQLRIANGGLRQGIPRRPPAHLGPDKLTTK